MKITNDIKYVGVNDHEIDLFEGQYVVENGMAYNSYVIMDEKIAVMDTVDARFTHEWLDNIENIIGSRQPDYLVIQHMEPDHSANIANFMNVYQNTKIVSTEKAFAMMRQFFGTDFEGRKIVVGEGDTLSLGKHNLTFVLAPMVHWPEVMVTYDSADKVLFSADGFGKFGALDSDYLSPARPCAYREPWLLSESLSDLVFLCGGNRRNRYRLYLCLRPYKKGGGDLGGQASKGGMSEGCSA